MSLEPLSTPPQPAMADQAHCGKRRDKEKERREEKEREGREEFNYRKLGCKKQGPGVMLILKQDSLFAQGRRDLSWQGSNEQKLGV